MSGIVLNHRELMQLLAVPDGATIPQQLDAAGCAQILGHYCQSPRYSGKAAVTTIVPGDRQRLTIVARRNFVGSQPKRLMIISNAQNVPQFLIRVHGQVTEG